MNRTLIALVFALVLSHGFAERPPNTFTLEPDNYMTAYFNDTVYWNRNRGGCSGEQYGLGSVFRVLTYDMFSRRENSLYAAAKADPNAIGIRVYNYFNDSAFDSVGNATRVFPVAIMAEIALEDIDRLNPNFQTEVMPDGFRGGACDSHSASALQTPVSIFVNNGGHIAYNPEYMSIPLDGVRVFYEERLLPY